MSQITRDTATLQKIETRSLKTKRITTKTATNTAKP
jgi:hypothetical protein